MSTSKRPRPNTGESAPKTIRPKRIGSLDEPSAKRAKKEKEPVPGKPITPTLSKHFTTSKTPTITVSRTDPSTVSKSLSNTTSKVPNTAKPQGINTSKSLPSPTAKTQPTIAPAPSKAQPSPASKSQSSSSVKSQPSPASKSQSSASVKSQPSPASKSQSSASVKSQPSPASKSQSSTSVKSQPSPVAKTQPSPASKSQPNSATKSQSNPGTKTQPSPVATSQASAVTKPQSSTTSKSQPAPATKAQPTATSKSQASVSSQAHSNPGPSTASAKSDSVPTTSTKEVSPPSQPPIVPVAAKESQKTLGGLPLYGELLPENGYVEVPQAARSTCEKLREIMMEVKVEKTDPGDKPADVSRKPAVMLFATLKRLNRLSHLYSKNARDQIQEMKLNVDGLHLQLQNLRYEAAHLQKEINNCLEFRSQHEDIDLVTEEEFYESAPESISKPEVTRTDEHQRMLARLEWELEKRKSLAGQQVELEATIQQKQVDKLQLETQFSTLLPALEKLREASLPIQEFFNLPIDWEREQHALAARLPPPLYILYTQSEGFMKAMDSDLKVKVCGEEEEVKSFNNALLQEKKGEFDSDSDRDNAEETSRKKKKRKRGKATEKVQLCTRAFPLSVQLTVTVKGTGSVTITFSYLPLFNAMCASVSGIELEGVRDSQQNLFIDKSTLLHCLFAGDSGRTSPNPAVSFNIRKHGGDNFSLAVRQYGFPYKWVQRICGIVMMSEGNGVEGAEGKDIKMAAQGVIDVVKQVKERLQAQYDVMKQLYDLEQLRLPSPVVGITSQLSRWRQLTLQDVQGFQQQFGKALGLFNLQERTSRFFLATFQREKARMHSIVCVTTEYPRTPPLFVVVLELSSGQREPYTIQVKDVEAQVNIHYPRSLMTASGEEKNLSEQLLRGQMGHLLVCLDRLIQFKTSRPQQERSAFLQIRGKGRLLSFNSYL